MAEKIYISSGETSGDIHGAGLAEKLIKINPELQLSGMGAQRMKEAGVELYRDCRNYSIMGFFGVIKSVFRFRKLINDVAEYIKSNKIKTVILIDYSGFNLRLANKIKPYGVNIIYFVSPQIWAWRTRRVKAIKKYVNRMITIFPFEAEFYSEHGVKVDYVGHPMLDTIPELTTEQRKKKSQGIKRRCYIDLNSPVLGLLPGSRKQEIEKMLPTMLETADMLAKDLPDMHVLIAAAPDLNFDNYQELSSFKNIKPAFVRNNTSDVLYASDVILTSSGTATIETALHGTPQVVMYKTNYLTYLIAKSLVKVKHIAMANLVAGRKVVPEFVQGEANTIKLVNALKPLLTDSEQWQQAHMQANVVREFLGENGAYVKAAEIVASELKSC